MIAIAIFSLSFFIWYVLYRLELCLNGSSNDKSILYYLWEEITWLEIFPGWKERRRKFFRHYEDEKNADTLTYVDTIAEDLPGIKHFICFHCLFLLAPITIYNLLW